MERVIGKIGWVTYARRVGMLLLDRQQRGKDFVLESYQPISRVVV